MLIQGRRPAGEFDPWAYAEAHRIRIEYRSKVLPSRAGEWYQVQRRILVAHGLTVVQEGFVITHELGHAYHGHVGCLPAQERAANSWAADRLIDPERYVAAEAIYGQDLGSIADELGVMECAVVDWRQNENERRRWADYFNGEMTA